MLRLLAPGASEPAWCLRYAPTPNWRLRVAERLAHGVVFGVELEELLSRRSCTQITGRIGSAANPGGRADGNRKQRGSRALTAKRVGRMKERYG